jgi:DNA-binding response OmpR family regulator
MDDYLSKPFRSRELLDAIARITAAGSVAEKVFEEPSEKGIPGRLHPGGHRR